MLTNESVQLHIRFVTERYNKLVSALDELVKVLVAEDFARKKAVAGNALTLANDLKVSIAEPDCPNWLNGLISALQYFLDDHWKQENLILHLMKNLQKIKTHEWAFNNSNENALNFDAIFQHYKSQSRLGELFDEIIKYLEEIQKSGEVDSVSMMEGLGKAIATLKKNKDGSYFSLNSTWSFLTSFIKNYMWVELSKIPVLGTAMEALEKTIRETHEEMFKVHFEIQQEMEKLVETEIKGLSKKTEFNFIGYDKTGNQPPTQSSTNHITDEA